MDQIPLANTQLALGDSPHHHHLLKPWLEGRRWKPQKPEQWSEVTGPPVGQVAGGLWVACSGRQPSQGNLELQVRPSSFSGIGK